MIISYKSDGLLRIHIHMLIQQCNVRSCTKLTLHTVAAIDMKSMGLGKWLVYIQTASVHKYVYHNNDADSLSSQNMNHILCSMRENIQRGLSTI